MPAGDVFAHQRSQWAASSAGCLMGCVQNSPGLQGSIELGLISLPASSIGRLTMRSAHSIPLAAAALWVGCVSAAVYCSEMSASAGRLPQRWAGWGMLAGFVVVGLVVV